jgi:hypothetical protein
MHKKWFVIAKLHVCDLFTDLTCRVSFDLLLRKVKIEKYFVSVLI